MDRKHEDRRAIVPQALGAPSRQQLLRRKPGLAPLPLPRALPLPLPRPVDAPEESVVTQCNRCEKDFVQKKARDQKSARGRVGRVPRLYKLCEHCREMGKGRSRRWQMRTREHGGLCRRCGLELETTDGEFVLCVKCRQAFRDRKHRRITEGKCIQCCEPLAEPITGSMAEQMAGPDSEGAGLEKPLQRRCQKCREARHAKGSSTKPFTSDFIQSMYK